MIYSISQQLLLVWKVIYLLMVHTILIKHVAVCVCVCFSACFYSLLRWIQTWKNSSLIWIAFNAQISIVFVFFCFLLISVCLTSSWGNLLQSNFIGKKAYQIEDIKFNGLWRIQIAVQNAKLKYNSMRRSNCWPAKRLKIHLFWSHWVLIAISLNLTLSCVTAEIVFFYIWKH